MRKSTIFSLVTLLVLIPLTLYLGLQLPGRWYYLTSTLIIVETMLPFFFSFEARKPQARELVILAVMATLAVVGRVAIPLPNFKAITGIIMITGIAFGPHAGFMTGSIAAFASNFFLSQGPWTPWQMIAYGLGGFLAGALFHGKTPRTTKNRLVSNVALAVFGFASVMLLVGPLLDICSVFTFGAEITPSFVLAVLAAGLPHNVIHALSCAATLLVLNRPLLGKLERLKTKYGMMEAQQSGAETAPSASC